MGESSPKADYRRLPKNCKGLQNSNLKSQSDKWILTWKDERGNKKKYIFKSGKRRSKTPLLLIQEGRDRQEWVASQALWLQAIYLGGWEVDGDHGEGRSPNKWPCWTGSSTL
jgi:hypothetical protein